MGQTEKLERLKQECEKALGEADFQLNIDMKTILRDILTNCRYTRTEEQVKEYQKRVIKAAQQNQ